MRPLSPTSAPLSLPPYASARALAKGEGWTFLDANESPEPPIYETGTIPALNRYPDPTADALREAIGERYGLSSAQVLCACGIDEIIELAIGTFSKPDDVIASAGPTYPLYRYRTLVQRRRYAEIPLTAEWQLPCDVLSCIPIDTTILFLCTPNNPTGTMLDFARITAITDAFPGLIIVDEAYGEFADIKGTPSAMQLVRQGAANILVCRTFSKAYRAAGLRLGYALGSAALISQLLKTKLPYNLNTLSQTIGVQIWSDREGMESNVKMLAARSVALAEACRKLGCTVPMSITNFFLLQLPVGMDGAQFYERLRREERILVRPFGTINGRESLRVTTGTPDENLRFLSVLTSFLS